MFAIDVSCFATAFFADLGAATLDGAARGSWETWDAMPLRCTGERIDAQAQQLSNGLKRK